MAEFIKRGSSERGSRIGDIAAQDDCRAGPALKTLITKSTGDSHIIIINATQHTTHSIVQHSLFRTSLRASATIMQSQPNALSSISAMSSALSAASPISPLRA